MVYTTINYDTHQNPIHRITTHTLPITHLNPRDPHTHLPHLLILLPTPHLNHTSITPQSHPHTTPYTIHHTSYTTTTHPTQPPYTTSRPVGDPPLRLPSRTIQGLFISDHIFFHSYDKFNFDARTSLLPNFLFIPWVERFFFCCGFVFVSAFLISRFSFASSYSLSPRQQK